MKFQTAHSPYVISRLRGTLENGKPFNPWLIVGVCLKDIVVGPTSTLADRSLIADC
jgi:hypothetical protein